MTDNIPLLEKEYENIRKCIEEWEEEYEENPQSLEDEVEYDDIVTAIIKSLKTNAIDYCYSRKELESILTEAKKQKLSLYYQEYFEKDGEFDYFKFVPVSYYKIENNQNILMEGQCYRVQDIPLDLQCVLHRRGKVYVFKDFNKPPKL